MIWRPRALTRTQREERRLEAARWLQAGQLSQAEIARRLGVSRMAVSQWAKHLRQHQDDLASLKGRPMLGRPPRLTAAQWQHIRQRLTQGALRAGFETERWTRQRIRALMVVACGIHDHAHYVARRLKALGWSPQAPAVYARERDEALVQAWLTHDWPRINKKLAGNELK
jgi:transposase